MGMEEKINLKEITLEEAMEQLNYYGASCFLTESFTNRTPFLKMRANWEKISTWPNIIFGWQW